MNFLVNNRLLDGIAETLPWHLDKAEFHLDLPCHNLAPFEVVGGIPPRPIEPDPVDGQMGVNMGLVSMHYGHPLMGFEAHALDVFLRCDGEDLIPWILAVGEG